MLIVVTALNGITWTLPSLPRSQIVRTESCSTVPVNAATVVLGLPQLQAQAASLEGVPGLATVSRGSPFRGPFPKIAGTGIGAEAVALALRQLGVPYVWGGASPASGFDCSGLVMYVYGLLGIRLPHYSGYQWYAGPRIPISQLQPGDIVFFEPSASMMRSSAMYSMKNSALRRRDC